MGTVSVVIPAFNPRRDWLDEAIRSAVEQAPPRLEVLVVDDGSAEPVTYDHPLVRVIRQENCGLPAARNRGIQEARGGLVALLDADDVWLPGKLAAQVPLMVDGVGLVATGFDLLTEGEVTPGWGGDTLTRRELLRGSGVNPSTVLARRDLLLGLGGFDETLRSAEDWDMWLRVAKVARLAHEPRALVLYRQHADAMSRDYRRLWRASMRVLWKNRSQVPLAGVRRQGQIYGAQAFDAYRATGRPSHLAWAVALWPGYVARQAAGRLRRQRQAGGVSR